MSSNFFYSFIARSHHSLKHPRSDTGGDDDDVKDDAESMADEEGGVDDCNEEDDVPGDELNLLSAVQHEFEKHLRQPSRNLCVKDIMLCFHAGSIYGKRTGFHKGMMITAPSQY